MVSSPFERVYADLPLDVYEDQIRVIELVPRHDHVVRCQMHGDAEPDSIIFINGIAVLIRENLWLALRAITRRQAHGPRHNRTKYLWVDGMSIDQNNNAERNHQVSLIQEIFSMASTVIVWLGDHQNEKELADFTDFMITPLSAWPESDIQITMIELLNRRYWTRMWIIQELLPTRNISLLCGTKSFSWVKLCSVLDSEWSRLYEPLHNPYGSLTLHNSDGTDLGKKFIKTSGAEMVRRKYRWAAAFDVYEAMRRYREYKCQDPRDKLFALLGLRIRTGRSLSIIRRRDHGIDADYTKSTTEIYVAVLHDLISKNTLWSMKNYSCSEQEFFDMLVGAFKVSEDDDTVKSATEKSMKQGCAG